MFEFATMTFYGRSQSFYSGAWGLIGGCIGSSKSTLVTMLNCWKFHASAQIIYMYLQCVVEQPVVSVDDTLAVASPLEL